MRLYLRGELADLDPRQAPPAIRVHVYNADTLSATDGNYSYQLRLPKTATNARLLGYSDTPFVAGGGQALPRIDARLEQGTILLQGRCEIEDANAESYSVRLISDDGGWLDGIRDKTLRAIESLPVLEYVGTDTPDVGQVSIFGVWATDESDGLGVQFPLVSYGNFAADPGNTNLNPLNGVLTIAESGGVVDGAILDNRAAWPLSVFDFRPAVYIRELVRGILTDAGLTPGGDFFTDSQFANIVLPYVGQEGPAWNFALLGVLRVLVESNITPSTGAPTVTVEKDGLSIELATGSSGAAIIPIFRRFAYITIIAPLDGRLDLTLDDLFTGQPLVQVDTRYRLFVAENVSDPVNFTLDLANAIYDTGIVNANKPIFQPSSAFSVSTQLNLVPGETYRIWLFRDVNSNDPWTIASTITAVPTGSTDDLDVAQVAPDIGQIEFLGGVLRHFNLYLLVDDRTGLASIAPRQDLPASALDLTDSAAVDAVTVVKQPQQIRLAYAREEGEELYPLEAFDERHTNGGGYHNGEAVYESTFAGTGTRAYLLPEQRVSLAIPTLNTLDEMAKPLGELGDGRQGFKLDYLPRLLRWEGLTLVPAAAEPLYVQDATQNLVTEGWPRTSFPDQLAYNTADGLYQTQFERHLTRLARAARTRIQVRLSPTDIEAIRQAPAVRIGVTVYQVEWVDYVADNASTLQLIRL